MGISLWQLLIVLVIVLLLFGTKKLRSIGSDLGGAVKGFRENIDKEAPADSANAEKKDELNHDDNNVIEGEVTHKDKDKV